MLNEIIIYIGSGIITLWGIAHIAPTKSVVEDFGSISKDKKRIIIMEWVAEGLTLCYIGALGMLITILGESQHQISIIVYRASAVMLIIMAGWTLFTGAKTSIVPIKICPIIKTVVAILFLLGSIL